MAVDKAEKMSKGPAATSTYRLSGREKGLVDIVLPTIKTECASPVGDSEDRELNTCSMGPGAIQSDLDENCDFYYQLVEALGQADWSPDGLLSRSTAAVKGGPRKKGWPGW